ncbi:hypothetical protein C2G38_2174899 [Gigaspora rosea]|uniref:Uncharacterized protein n=1 Tax=Gigaspora rosea TaxID=44941 RepID=A0A397VHW9_9GLOM|nr:hypothetical protein C2G38_2174899 [Gigaspora rosea]
MRIPSNNISSDEESILSNNSFFDENFLKKVIPSILIMRNFFENNFSQESFDVNDTLEAFENKISVNVSQETYRTSSEYTSVDPNSDLKLRTNDEMSTDNIKNNIIA